MFYIDPANGINYSLVICLTSQSYNRAANVIDATSKCGTLQLNGTKTRSFDIEGQIMYNPEVGQVSEKELNDYFEADTKIGWKQSRAIPVDGDVIYSGVDAIISNLTATAPLDGVSTFSATLQINGVPIVTVFEGS